MKREDRSKKIYPVVLAVPEPASDLRGREKVLYLSTHARKALKISAEKSGATYVEPQKDEEGVPLPFNGYYWSVSHKEEFVGGVVAREKIGLDIEKIRPVSNGLCRKIAEEDEWGLSSSDRQMLFFRYWTSKEAVVKAAGTGFKDIGKCRVIHLLDEKNLIIAYAGEKWRLEHYFFKDYLASVVKNRFNVKWAVDDLAYDC